LCQPLWIEVDPPGPEKEPVPETVEVPPLREASATA
jgi:hypothetical protein